MNIEGDEWIEPGAGRDHLVVAYMPILKGRDADFTAVGHLSQAMLAHILPVFEVAPGTDGPAKAAGKFGTRVLDWLPRNLTIAVDVRYLADAGYAADLHDGQAVLRLGGDTRDPDDLPRRLTNHDEALLEALKSCGHRSSPGWCAGLPAHHPGLSRTICGARCGCWCT